MKINYLDDEDLSFLHRCSEEHLEAFTRILTHNENGKPRLSSTLLRNQTFQAMAGHPERYRRNWQLIAGELQHFGGDSIANTLRRHGKFYREILLDVCKRLKIKADKHTSTPEIEQHLLEHFLEHSWKKMDDRQKADFFTAVECRVNDHKALLPHLLQTNKLAQGVNHLLEIRLAKILRTHAAVSVIGHGLVRGAGLGGPLGAAFNGVKAVSGSAYRVTIPAVLHIACLRQMTRLHQVKNEIGEKYPARS
ncbi:MULTISPECIES: acidic protein MsyB [Klebsiella]|uniref:acidic protein MsyB n=1 Tax=Klebsiella TaxID=570 RepID=UPI0007DAD749|nr:acidic protein MsyB [Klebsiella michiganensis]MBS5176392.1 acidic protein MsyB [Klebsiella oxytoca]OFU91277.1 hypothetical protein HMPREF3111_00145 [Proteus sp. HMSC10D02]MBZ6555790.1 acidic protein MsyB [Klebsiella michiganensis]MBZ7373449.1 acidic protein MsyB [Klebsiella michiganensis]MCF0026820.1 acidic protein MsyB [Klebsiella michiganensis]